MSVGKGKKRKGENLRLDSRVQHPQNASQNGKCSAEEKVEWAGGVCTGRAISEVMVHSRTSEFFFFINRARAVCGASSGRFMLGTHLLLWYSIGKEIGFEK